MAKLKSAFLCSADVLHTRLKPKKNHFLYRVFYLYFDISKISDLRSKFLSLNRFNLFGFYNKDHGNRDGSSLEAWIRNILDQKGLNHKIDKIFLLTYPRILGYVFNPVSFWFCLDKNQKLIATLAEVNNTFGENHNYLIFNHDHTPILKNQWFECDKEFHVSPFFQTKGIYKFRFLFEENKIISHINYLSNSKQKSLLTSLICKKKNLCDKELLKFFFLIPLMTFKVVFLIHWQAARLILQKNKYISKPKKQNFNLTINK